MGRFLLQMSRILLTLFALHSVAFAAAGIGDLANQLEEPVSILSDFIGTGSLIVGITCLFGAFLRYLQYRVNPLMSPMSTVIVLVILGLALIGLPFLYKVIGYGVPYPAHAD